MSRLYSSVTVAAALYLAVIAVFASVYISQATAYETGAPLMPVDDAYIHFQYARQAAEGEPFVYNPGEDPSSGATSLLYPFILAAGYKLGFTGLYLGYWAYAIGSLALLGAALAVRAISLAAGLPQWLAMVMGVSVACWGALVWHAFSGMETALVVAFTVLTFHAFDRVRVGMFAAAASVLAMLRPEASVMAVLASLLYFVREIAPAVQSVRSRFKGNDAGDIVSSEYSAQIFTFRYLPLLLPIVAATVQPLLNLALTGTSNAAGSQAKSLLSIVPFDFEYVVGRILENFFRAWETFLLGIGSDRVWMLPPLMGIAAVFGLFQIARRRPFTALLTLLWLLLIFSAISTLDTAAWHFRRYHMPLLALAFPLTAHAAAGLSAYPRSRAWLVGYTMILSLVLNQFFVGYHAANVESVAAQPLSMSRWISEHTPPDSLIAVHDVGLIRYLGGRDTLDMVGLTTPGMADAWRNGPGAVGEALVTSPHQPDYFAAYDDARGLSYLSDSLYGEQLVGFRHEFNPASNVALGGPFQGVYRPVWTGEDEALEPRADAVRTYIDGFIQVDMLNVADLVSERDHSYSWSNISRFDGFASEMYLFDVPGCSANCTVLDGGRRMNGSESFTMDAQPGRDHILITRFRVPNGGEIRVVINESYAVKRTLPFIAGKFVEIPTLIPASLITSDNLRVRIEPANAGELIFPYRHWLYAGSFETLPEPQTLLTFQDGAIALSPSSSLNTDSLIIDLVWWSDGTATGDLIAFVHLYADLSEPPVAQADLRPGGGALPPGTWLPGTRSDRIVLDLSELQSGTYTLAIGLYHALTFERIEPVLAQSAPIEITIDSDRVIVDTIVLPRQ